MERDGYMSIHVVDMVSGVSAAGLKVDVDRRRGIKFQRIKTVECKANGYHAEPLVDEHAPGEYRLTLHVADYYATFMEPVLVPPYLTTTGVDVNCGGPDMHHHVALAITPTSFLLIRGN